MMNPRQAPEKFEHGGRQFEIAFPSDGTVTLMLWVDGRSLPIGPFANRETARHCAENLPADFDPKKLMASGFGTVFAESEPE